MSPFRLEVAKRIAAINTAIGCPADVSIAAADRVRCGLSGGVGVLVTEHGWEPMDAWELAGADREKDSRPTGLPRVFRTVELVLFHAAGCSFKYSMRTLCGVR